MKFTLNITNKKLLKKILAISLPIFVVGASITTYVIKTNNNDKSNPVNNNITIVNGVKRQVYLATEDNLLMPVTVTIEKEELVTDEITNLVNLLKEDSVINHSHFKNILNKDCELKNVTLEDKTVTLNFNEKFNEYDVSLEKRIVESLVWTCLQFDDIETLKIQVEDVDLTHMPQNNTPIPSSLNKSIGINNHLMVGSSRQKSVNVFFEKTIDENTYYVPVSVKVEDLDNQYEEVLYGMNLEMPLYTTLTRSNLLNKIEVLEYNTLDENNNLNLTLSSKALYDEKTVDNKVFDYLVMNLMFNDKNIETVSITINEELVSVSGYEETAIQVSNVTYNEIKL